MEHILSLLLALGDKLIGLVPGAILRWRYPQPKLAEQVVFVADGVGPHLYIRAGKPMMVSGLRLMVVNRLPFPIELTQLSLDVRLESTYLLKLENHKSTTVERRGLAQLDLDYDLTDNQALMIRQYPTPAPVLRLNGTATFHSRVRDFHVFVQLGTRAWRQGE